MQPDTEAGMSAAVGGGLGRGGPARHQAGAGHDALLAGADNAPVHPRALPEVVGVHDYRAFHRHRSGSFPFPPAAVGGSVGAFRTATFTLHEIACSVRRLPESELAITLY